MTFRREKDLQEKVKEVIIKRYGSNVWYYHPRTTVQKGVPDIILSFYGYFIAIELKRNVKAYGATKLQLYNLMKISLSHGYFIVSDSVDEIMDLLNIFHLKYDKERKRQHG